jgi:hypothetical protein
MFHFSKPSAKQIESQRGGRLASCSRGPPAAGAPPARGPLAWSTAIPGDSSGRGSEIPVAIPPSLGDSGRGPLSLGDSWGRKFLKRFHRRSAILVTVLSRSAIPGARNSSAIPRPGSSVIPDSCCLPDSMQYSLECT